MRVSASNTVPETIEHRRSRVLTVMSAMRAAGYGYEDIFVALNAMGFPISRAACRGFVIPQTHDGPAQGLLKRGR